MVRQARHERMTGPPRAGFPGQPIGPGPPAGSFDSRCQANPAASSRVGEGGKSPLIPLCKRGRERPPFLRGGWGDLRGQAIGFGSDWSKSPGQSHIGLRGTRHSREGGNPGAVGGRRPPYRGELVLTRRIEWFWAFPTPRCSPFSPMLNWASGTCHIRVSV